jgi:hypothetical protein
MINQERKVIFCHVPKNAGQSVVGALTTAGGYRFVPYPMVEEDRTTTWTQGECRRILAHVPRQLWDGCFKFAFVRNPWDRLVSGWQYTRQRRKHDLSFERFVAGLGHIGEPSIRWHTMPQCAHLLVDGVVAVDFLGRFEALDRDWQEVGRRIGNPAAPLPRRNSTDRRGYREYYDHQTAAAVAEIFARDVELFGYSF